jgi:hypothetical protein
LKIKIIYIVALGKWDVNVITWEINDDQRIWTDLRIFLLCSWIEKRATIMFEDQNRIKQDLYIFNLLSVKIECATRETETRRNMLGDKHKYNFTSIWTWFKTAISIYTSLSKGAANDQNTTRLSWSKGKKNAEGNKKI